MAQPDDVEPLAGYSLNCAFESCGSGLPAVEVGNHYLVAVMIQRSGEFIEVFQALDCIAGCLQALVDLPDKAAIGAYQQNLLLAALSYWCSGASRVGMAMFRGASFQVEGDGEYAAFAKLAFGGNVAIHQANKLTADRQAKAAAFTLNLCTARLSKPLENCFEVGFCNAAAGIADLDHNVVVAGLAGEAVA